MSRSTAKDDCYEHDEVGGVGGGGIGGANVEENGAWGSAKPRRTRGRQAIRGAAICKDKREATSIAIKEEEV